MGMNLNPQQQQILDLLARNMSAADVAAVVGISESYISQLRSNEAFCAALQSKSIAISGEKAHRIAEMQKIHNKYLDLENVLLDSLHNRAKAGLMKAGEQIKLLSIVGAKKTPEAAIEQPASPQNNTFNTIVNVQLPARTARQFVMSSKKEIIGLERKDENGKVETMSFAPMQTSTLKELAKLPAEEKALPNTVQSIPMPAVKSNTDLLDLFGTGPVPQADELSALLKVA